MVNRGHVGLVAAACAVIVCAGCEAGLWRSAPLPPGSASGAQALALSKPNQPLLYVASGRLSMYVLGQSEPLRSTKIDNYVSKATLALDPFGNLIEGNGNPSYSQVLVYDARTLHLVRTFNGAGWFDGLAINGAGYIYAGGGGPIGVLSPGATRYLGAIQRGAYSVGPLLFDRAGNLYAGNLEGHSVSIYAPIPGTWRMKFVRSVTDGVDLPQALVIGPSGDLFVANWPYHGKASVTIYTPGGTKLVRKVSSGIDAPLALAVDSKRQLYVGNAPLRGGSKSQWCGWVSVYRLSGGAQLLRKITNGICTPLYLGIGPQGDLYVGNIYAGHQRGHTSVTVYTSGGARLIRSITEGVNGGATFVIGSP